MQEQVTLRTEDQFEIAANYVATEGKYAAILLHMMPATKESWEAFAKQLEEIGVSSIAIDERGHGASTGGPDGYKTFTNTEQVSKKQDVLAAINFLEGKGFKKNQLFVIGASIGANLAIEALHDFSDIPAGIAFSPGLDYKGVSTRGLVNDLQKGQEILLLASEDDVYSALSVQELQQENVLRAESLIVKDWGHGTELLDEDELLQKTLKWIKDHLV